jgi:hypothetical protein
MTAGTVSQGASTSKSPYYYYRNWNGTDGKSQWNSYYSTSVRRNHAPYEVYISLGNDPVTEMPLGYRTEINYVGLDPDPAFRASITANDELAMIGNLINSIKGHQFNLGVAVAEGKQTVSLVVSTLGKLVNVVRSLKKGRFDLALRHLGGSPSKHKQLYPSRKMRSDPRSLTSKDISASWLELQYGWTPLLSDVYQAENLPKRRRC